MDISVVVPLFNEAESLPELAAWIEKVMTENSFTYEVLMINDGSTDNSWEVIKKLSADNPCIKGVCFRRNYGKSPALYTGFEWKQKRYDPLSKTLPTKLFNATARKVSGIKNLHDFNCGLKAYRNDVVKHIEVYGDMHRYIPYLAKNAGFDKIGEKVVHHQARKYGKSKFGLDRFVNGYLDLMTLWFQSKFGVKPMHFFGLLGSLMFFIGLIAVIAVGAIKLYNMHAGNHYILVTDSPYFYLALTCMILGTQLFLTGFLGELIARNSAGRNHYEISEEIK